MPRIRAIKPEFWASPNHPADPWARLLFVAMWNWADDAGTGTANARELLGFAFPNDENIDTTDIKRMFTAVADSYGVVFYKVAGRDYFHVPTFNDHQKFDRRRGGRHPLPADAEELLYGSLLQVTTKSESLLQVTTNFPAPDPETDPDLHQSIDTARRADESAQKQRRNRGTGEQGNRGTGEQGNEKTEDPDGSSSSAVAVATTEPARDEPGFRDDVDRLCERLAELVRQNAVTSKPVVIRKDWRRAARCLIDNDGVDYDRAVRVLDWSQTDPFWTANIRSMPKLREKFETLEMQMNRNSRRSNASMDSTHRGLADMQRIFGNADQKAIQ
ncbi:hypothetical protein SEA_APHELION_104 [Gordonia phage Aphelion]|uniref:Helix-turn-helix DNA binding domain protein n=1 Tax=Gordonia phage Aphelion TaxID=2507860 RepID=A0A410TD66_9CAUD|nr:hypothetical protein SEA_APHELION_104 [Gordonia phage Aphelion]QYC53589.1 RepA-like replication initiator [Gordonia phage Norvs]